MLKINHVLKLNQVEVLREYLDLMQNDYIPLVACAVNKLWTISMKHRHNGNRIILKTSRFGYSIRKNGVMVKQVNYCSQKKKLVCLINSELCSDILRIRQDDAVEFIPASDLISSLHVKLQNSLC